MLTGENLTLHIASGKFSTKAASMPRQVVSRLAEKVLDQFLKTTSAQGITFYTLPDKFGLEILPTFVIILCRIRRKQHLLGMQLLAQLTLVECT
jgi:hypothetical protein